MSLMSEYSQVSLFFLKYSFNSDIMFLFFAIEFFFSPVLDLLQKAPSNYVLGFVGKIKLHLKDVCPTLCHLCLSSRGSGDQCIEFSKSLSRGIPGIPFVFSDSMLSADLTDVCLQ